MLAQSYHMLGCFYLKPNEDFAKSREVLEKAAALGERLVQAHPDVVSYKVALAGHHVNLILVYQGLGKPDQAAVSADKAVAILEAVTRDNPREPSYAHRLGSCYMNRGYLAITTGRPEQALESYRRAADVLEALYRKAGDWSNVRQDLASAWSDIRHDLASAHGGQADALVRLNRPVESLPHWKRLLELSEGPDRDDYRLRYGLALVQAGDYAGAEAEAQVVAAKASGEMLFNLACLYSLCCSAVRTDEKIAQGDRESRAEKYAAQAVAALRQAAMAGLFKSSAYREHLDQDVELTPLRARAEFQRLLRSLEERLP
jgi:tetratricopeptide (TPR) repeat protein